MNTVTDKQLEKWSKDCADFVLHHLSEECSLDLSCVSKADRSNIANGIKNDLMRALQAQVAPALWTAAIEFLTKPGLNKLTVAGYGRLDREGLARTIKTMAP